MNALKEAYIGCSMHSKWLLLFLDISLWRITLTSGYRCAKISISLSVLRSKLPQCHKCVFLKQTNIIFDCLLHRFPLESQT